MNMPAQAPVIREVRIPSGLVGISLFMGGGSTPSRTVVQSAGKGYRLPTAALKEEFKLAPVLHCCCATPRR